MAKFHDTGTVCEATKRDCPLGLSDNDHIEADSVQEFEKKLEEKMAASAGSTLRAGAVVDDKNISRPSILTYSKEQQNFLREYRDGGNWTINRGLRGLSALQGRALDCVKALDNIIEKSEPLKKSLRVMRSINSKELGNKQIPSSGIYKDPAFLSTSTNGNYIEETLKSGVTPGVDQPSDTVLSITLPKGFKALGFSLEDKDYALEEEVLLPRGTKIIILEDSGFVNGVRRIRGQAILENPSPGLRSERRS